MSGVLLDTNVISELVRPAPNPAVVSFVEGADGWLSIVTLHELRFGLLLLPAARERSELGSALDATMRLYADRILPVGRPEAERAASLRATIRAGGGTLHIADAMIAATASVYGLALATRNIADFEGTEVPLLNPWAG